MSGTKRKLTSTIDENLRNIKFNKVGNSNDFILDTNKKIYIILRVSTKHINEISLQKQKDEILKNLGNINLNDVQVITFNGKSAYNDSNYTVNLTEIFQNTINKIFYYYSIDRFSRNVSLGAGWLNMIKKNNHKIYFYTNQLYYPNNGDYQRIINLLTEAETESRIKSDRTKESRNHRISNNIFTNGFGFGNNMKRPWELKLIQFLLKYIDFIHCKIELTEQEIKDYLIDYIQLLPIDRELKQQKINFIQNETIQINKNTVENNYDDNQDYSSISEFLNVMGIPFLKINTITKDFTEGYFSSINSPPDSNINHIYQSEPYTFIVLKGNIDNFYETIGDKREITLESISRKMIHFNPSIFNRVNDLNRLKNDIYQLNRTRIKGLTPESLLKKGTKINVPEIEGLLIPEDNQWTWKQKISPRFFINIEDILENHQKNLEKQCFIEQMNHIDSFGLNNLRLNSTNNSSTEGGGEASSSSSSSSFSENTIDEQFRRLSELLKTTREMYGDNHEETIKIHKKISSLCGIE